MVKTLLEDIRVFLHDVDAIRWTDKSLIRLLDKAQKDLVFKTKALKAIYRVGLRDDRETVKLPSDIDRVTRVTLNGCKLNGKTHSEIDDITCGCGWETATGTPKYFILDKTNRNRLRLYPIPNGTTMIFYQETSLGLFSDIGVDKYGIIVDIKGFSEVSTVGTTTDIVLSTLVLEVHYDKHPRTLINLKDKIEVDEMMKQALVHYVCGNALRADRDSNSRSLGAEELALYDLLVKELKKSVSNSYTDGTEYAIKLRKF